MRYPDDDVWHERALLYPVGKRGCKLWVIGTPDWAEADGSGIYIERIEEGDDIDSVQPLALDGSRPFLDDDICAFSVPLSKQKCWTSSRTLRSTPTSISRPRLFRSTGPPSTSNGAPGRSSPCRRLSVFAGKELEIDLHLAEAVRMVQREALLSSPQVDGVWRVLCRAWPLATLSSGIPRTPG